MKWTIRTGLLIYLFLFPRGENAFSARLSNQPLLARKPALVAPLLLDNHTLSNIWIYPAANEANFLLDAGPFLEALYPIVKESTWQNLNTLAAPQGTLSLAKIRSSGIKPVFDQRELVLNLAIPPELRRPGNLQIVNNGPNTEVTSISAPLSGYLNLRNSKGISYPVQANGRHELPFVSDMQLATNISGLLLEGNANYTQFDSSQWKRSDMRISMDNEGRMLRYSAGDLQFPLVGYQVFRPMGGASITKDFTIQPYTITRPNSHTQILLKRPSDVEVYVNGHYISKMRLPAGPVNLQSFPLASGLNHVEVKIINDLGQTEQIDLSFLYDSQLLGRGVQQFTYNIGAPSTPLRSSYKYDTQNISASLFHRMGLSDRYTLGLNFQGDHSQHIVGWENIYLSPIGIWTSDTASSWYSRNSPALAQRLRYRSLDYWHGEAARMRFSFETEYFSPGFFTFGTPIPNNPFSWSLEGNVNQNIPWDLSLGTGYRYQFSRSSDPDRRTFRADLSRSWFTDWRSSIEYNFTHDRNSEHKIFISISWTERSGRFYANATYDSLAHSKRLNLANNPANPYNGVRFAGGIEHSPQFRQADLQANYTNPRSSLHFSYLSSGDAAGSIRHQSTLGLSTALVWAGSSVAISRPISDSFIILPANHALQDYDIPINRNDAFSEAESNSWGPAVLPDTISYNHTPISIDSTKLPVGYSVGREFYVAKSRYKSGVEIPLGGEPSVVLRGILITKDGKPLVLASGELVLKNDSTKSLSFFTNRKGEFWVENVRPGTYEIQIDSGHWQPLTLTVAEGKMGIFKLAPMTLKAAGDK